MTLPTSPNQSFSSLADRTQIDRLMFIVPTVNTILNVDLGTFEYNANTEKRKRQTEEWPAGKGGEGERETRAFGPGLLP